MTHAEVDMSGSDGGCLYTLRPNEEYRFVVGSSGPHQYLLKEVPKGVLLLQFAASGELLGQRLVPRLSQESSDDAIRRVLRETAIILRPISIREFYLPNYQLGIRRLPSHLEEFVTN